MSPKAIAVAGLSAIAIAASGCGGDSDPAAKFRAWFNNLKFRVAFKKSFGEAPWYHHITGIEVNDKAGNVTAVNVTTDLGPESAWDIVGPICESSDVFARERSLPELRVDDLVAVLDTGAYGAVMASNYNRRFLAPEVLVDNDRFEIIRRRQTIDDVLALES